METRAARARLGVVGANHRSSSAATRDALFVPDGETRGVLAELRRMGLGQAVLISTCDRVEVQFAHDDPDAAFDIVRRAFARRLGREPGRELYAHADAQALHHVFAVACSLDSQVIGEPQVLGQLKAAHALSRDMGLVGAELEAALAHAYSAAKRVRSETAIGERPVSLAAAAAAVARDVHGDLKQCAGLLLGLGEMGELLVEHFRRGGLKRLAVAAPAAARAGELARRLEAHHVPFDRIGEALADADLVVTALGTGRVAIDGVAALAALRKRRRRPILFLDLGVPEDVAREVEKIDGAYRYGIDDLEGLALKGRDAREAAFGEAAAIVEAELAAFQRALAVREASGTIVALRRHFESERLRALAEKPDDPARATELLVHRLLHAPTALLRELAADGTPASLDAEALIARAFGLDQPENKQ
jgi:glutamyl-tRNA reductase